MAQFVKSTIVSAGIIAAALMLGAGAALTADAGDAEEGEFVFADNCEICHSAEQGGPHKIGPNLFGVVGRMSGTAEGYSYSPAMMGANITWDADSLGSFLNGPADVVPGTKMGFPGFDNPEDEANLIAYLSTLH